MPRGKAANPKSNGTARPTYNIQDYRHDQAKRVNDPPSAHARRQPKDVANGTTNNTYSRYPNRADS